MNEVARVVRLLATRAGYEVVEVDDPEGFFVILPTGKCDMYTANGGFLGQYDPVTDEYLERPSFWSGIRE